MNAAWHVRYLSALAWPVRWLLSLKYLSFGLLLLFAHIGAAQAGPVLRPAAGARFFGPLSVWTAGSTSTPIFHPLSPPLPSAGVVSGRFAVQMTQDSGDCKLRAAVRFSNDGVTWDAAKEVSVTYVTDDTVQYNTAYVDLLALAGTPARSWLQYGVEVVNRTGATVALCNGALRVDEQVN